MLEKYLEELLLWNKKINLISRKTGEDEIQKKHIADSLALANYYDFSRPLNVIDIGTGAGLPGIPLKIMYPNIKLVLVDSTRKKVDFLNHIIDTLGLKNTSAVWDRAENLAPSEFDVAFARAVSKLDLCCKYALPLLRTGGVFIAQKGDNPEDEIEDAKKTIKYFGAEISEMHKFELPGIGTKRSVLLIKKIKKIVDKA